MPGPEVFTLMIECGRRNGDGLPAGAIGARLLAYAPGADELDAVRAAVALVKQAGFAPLDVEGHGALVERLADGQVGADERALIERAAREGAVVIAEVTPIFPEAEAG
jgi:hypothetical protein